YTFVVFTEAISSGTKNHRIADKIPPTPFTKGGEHFPLWKRGIEGDLRMGSSETQNGITPAS
ncbi:MAG: hypothetical protein O7E52_23390, partial [Candidatus Poribacteria bacterium]|nr:hypothetical protein [Candidatus Poribacteria bacterium]